MPVVPQPNNSTEQRHFQEGADHPEDGSTQGATVSRNLVYLQPLMKVFREMTLDNLAIVEAWRENENDLDSLGRDLEMIRAALALILMGRGASPSRH
jgi:hypothetical protein